jgi:hypothetical protein
MITSLRRTELALTASQRHAEPPKLISELKGDVDWIVMKALEKDRNRRYETANGLAMDIRRYIDNEPVVARPPSRRYRLQKLVRRNKIIFAAVGAVAVTLLIGLGSSTWLFFREREARQQETRLLAEAEDRAKITQAVMFVSQGKFEEADGILNEVKTLSDNPTLDGISAFRSVGEWMALQRRWQLAADRYYSLIKIDKLDTLTQIGLDYEAFGVVTAENPDREVYRHFWEMSVTNFSAKPNESVFIACVLFPLDKAQIETLKPTAAYFENRCSLPSTNRISQWTFMPISLWKYRCGDYEGALEWSQRGVAQKAKFSACDVDLHLIMAMAEYQCGESSEADSELGQQRQLVEAKFRAGLDRGRAESGYWFDWYFASLLLKEATSLIDGSSPPMKTASNPPD